MNRFNASAPPARRPVRLIVDCRAARRAGILSVFEFLRIGSLFFFQAFVIAGWLTRIPDLMIVHDIDKATMGLVLFAAPFGTLITLPFVGRRVEALSTGRVALVGGTLVALSMIPIGLAPTWPLLAAAIFVFGVCNAALEVAINSAADWSEQRRGHKIMARCHACWSVGMMAGALAAGGAAEFGIGVGIHLAVVCALGLALLFFVRNRLPEEVFETHAEPAADGKAPLFVLPERQILKLCAMAIGVTLAEGAVYDWSSVYLRNDIGATPFQAGVGFAAFALSMAVGRMTGDWLRTRFAGPTLIRSCALLAAIGISGFVFAPNVVAATLGLIVLGAGASLVFPIAVSAIGPRSGPRAPSNIAGLSVAIMTALLIAPPITGIVGESVGLGIAFLLTLPTIAVTFFTAGEAAPAGLQPDEGPAPVRA